MNFAQKRSELLSSVNEVKNLEENDKDLKNARPRYIDPMSDHEYVQLVREALYEKLYGSRRYTREVKKLIAVLLATESPAYVALAKQLESLRGSQYYQDIKKIDAMMTARKRLKDSYIYESDRKTTLTTYKEYKEAMQMSKKYGREFERKARKCGYAREILNNAYYIISDLERAIPSLERSYSWREGPIDRYSVEEVLRQKMDKIEDFLSEEPRIRKYLNSNESKIELKR